MRSGKWSRVSLTMLFAATAISSTVRAAEPAAPKKVTTVEGITEYLLGNGLRVLLFPDQSSPKVTVNITYFVGSRHEGYGETGMAHLLEHMVFKGTPDHPQIWKSLQDHGAQFNGTTWYDRTNYFETLAATDENLDFALKMEADRMVNSFIAKKDLDSEFSVVRNEFEMGENNPVGVLSERTVAAAYLWHNYGKSTIGSREDIERVPIERLQAFYKKFYQPDNAMLVVAGKFDEAKTLAKINDIFGKIPRPNRTLEPTYTVEPIQDGEREVFLRRVGDTQAIDVVYHISSGSHEDFPALDTLSRILTADKTGRLYKALIETQLATSVSADAAQLCEPGYFEITVEARLEKSLPEIRKVLLEVLDGLGNTEFTAEEVDRAKNQFTRQFDLRLTDVGRIGIGLSEYAAMGDWRLMFLHRDRMKAVTPKDVKRVASHYFKPTNRTIGMFTPDKDPDRVNVPPTPDVLAMVKDYKGSQELAQGEEFDATPTNIESRTQRTKTPAGIKLALLPKKTRGNRVNANLTFRYGTEATLKDNVDAAGMIAPMLMMGTEKLSRRDIKDRLDQLKANVSISGGGGGMGRFGVGAGGAFGTLNVSIETTRPNLPAVVELVGDLLRNSKFPQEEFDKYQKETLASLEESISEPTVLAGIELRKRMVPYGPDDIRYVKSIQEQIDRVKAIKLDDVRKVYKDFISASHAEGAIVGDFDPAEIGSLLDQTFANWKSAKPFERVAMPFKPNKVENKEIQTPDKQNAMYMLGVNIQLKDDDADYPAAFMANYILGGSASSRLLNRLRQKEGLSYNVGSMVQASPHEQAGSFIAFGICAPENARKAVVYAKEEIDTLLKDGITAKELEDARAGWLDSLKVNIANDGAVAGMLSRDLFLDRTMKFLDDRIAKVKALTPEQVSAAARKYITPDKLTVVTAGDFDKAAAAPPTAGTPK